MDEIDQQIVALLRSNARRSFQDIGGRVALSAPAVKRRVDRLQSAGVIKAYAAVVDPAAMGCAVHTTLNDGEAYTTLELKVNYVRAITEATGRVVATGSVIHRGGRVATAEARLTDADDRLLAHGTSTCLIM